jgi:hypothetical protein
MFPGSMATAFHDEAIKSERETYETRQVSAKFSPSSAGRGPKNLTVSPFKEHPGPLEFC